MIKDLYEAHLPVTDLQRAVEFYQTLGLELSRQVKPGDKTAFFWINKHNSWIGLWENHSAATTPYHPSLRHIALYVTLEDLKNAKVWLKERGIEMREDFGFPPKEPIVMPDSGHAMVYFNDPDGNSIEFITKLHIEKPDWPMMYLSEWEERISEKNRSF